MEEVNSILEEDFSSLWVEGEITGHKVWSSGHAYFSLRDHQQAVLKSVMYRSSRLRLPAQFEPKDGIEVFAFGRLNVYAPKGDFQFVVERMFPKGVGAQDLALRQLKEKLQQLGYFDVKRKRPLPRFPCCVAVIASPQGAAIRDVLTILRNRWPATRVVFHPSRVQGDGAADDVAEAIRRVNRWTTDGHIDPAVLILARGGGSVEDLWAFNMEAVARAIFESRLPVISAVGHEIDVTVADLVADLRAATPSNAAELVVPDRRDLLNSVLEYRTRFAKAMRRCIGGLSDRLESLAQRRVFLQPTARIREWERTIDDVDLRLRRAMNQRMEKIRHTLDAASGRLGSLSPLNVLARGYSLTHKDGSPQIVRSVEQVRPGDYIVTTLHQGRIRSRVEATEPAPPGRPG
jgi:exodeoxyribonuclease VII large subunit